MFGSGKVSVLDILKVGRVRYDKCEERVASSGWRSDVLNKPSRSFQKIYAGRALYSVQCWGSKLLASWDGRAVV